MNGKDISNFCIVYEAPADKALLGSYWNEEYDHGYLSACRLAELIKNRFGVELEIYSDAERAKGDNEILVGRTDRIETSTRVLRLRAEAYKVFFRNEKLIVCGGSTASTYHAIDALETYFNTDVEDDVYTFEASQSLEGTYDLKKIAILGDSITFGALSTDYLSNDAAFGYVAHLRRMLWKEATVVSYAQPGACMRSDLDGITHFGNAWSDFISESGDFDIVLVMLGTNDGYCDNYDGGTWSGVWTNADDTSFLTSAEYIFDKIAEKNPGVRMALMNCPVYYRTAATDASHFHSSPRTIALQEQVAAYAPP